MGAPGSLLPRSMLSIRTFAVMINELHRCDSRGRCRPKEGPRAAGSPASQAAGESSRPCIPFFGGAPLNRTSFSVSEDDPTLCQQAS
jgi:hypothetical protein